MRFSPPKSTDIFRRASPVSLDKLGQLSRQVMKRGEGEATAGVGKFRRQVKGSRRMRNHI